MSSPDFNIIHLRNTQSYNPDGSYVSTGYVFTVSTNGRHLFTNNLNLNNLSASTLSLQSTLRVDNLVVGSTLNVTSSLFAPSIGFSTLVGSTFVTTTGLVSSLTTSSLLTGNMTFSTLTGSTVTTTNVTTSGLGVSTLTGSSLVTTNVTTSVLGVSTLTGSSIVTTDLQTSALGVSTLTGSTVVASGLTFSAADFSTMIGSTIYLNAASISSLTISSIIAPNGFGSTGPTGLQGPAGSGGGGGGGGGTGYTGPTGVAGAVGQTALVSRTPTTTQVITAGVNQLVIWGTLDSTQSTGDTNLTYSNGLFTNNSSIALPLAIDYTIVLNTTGSGSSYIGLNGAANAYGVFLNDTNIFSNSFTILLNPGSSFGVYYNDNATPSIQTTSRITVSRLLVGQQGPTGMQGGNSEVAIYAANPSATQSITATTETLLLWDSQDVAQSSGTTGLTYLNGLFTNNNAGTLPLLVEYQVLLDTTGGGASYVKLNGTTTYGNMLNDNNSFTNSFVVRLPPGQTLGVYYMDNNSCVVQTSSRLSITLLVSGLGQTGAAGYIGADGRTGPTGYMGLDGPTGATGIQGPVGQVASLCVRPTVTQAITAGVDTLTLWGTVEVGQTVGATGLSYAAGLFTNTTASMIPLLVEYTIITNVTGTGSSYVSVGGTSYGPFIHSANISTNSFTVFVAPGLTVGVYYADNAACVIQTTSRLRLSVLTAGQAGPSGATGPTGPVGQVATLSAQPSVTQSLSASTLTAIKWGTTDITQSANQTGLLYSSGTGLFTNTTMSWVPVLVEYSVYLDTTLGGYSFIGVNGSTNAFGGTYNDSNWFSNSYTVLVPAGQTVGVYYTDNGACVVQTASRIRLSILTAGSQGATGWTGVTGPAGYIGLDGATGPTGIRGVTGPVGQVSILSQQPLVTQSILASTLTAIVWGSTDLSQSSGLTGLTHAAGLYTNTTGSTLPVLVEYTVYLNSSQGGYTFIGLNGSTSAFGGMYTSSNWFCNSYTVLVPSGQTVGVYYVDNGACIVQTDSRIRLTVLTAGPQGPTGPTGWTGMTGPLGTGPTGPTGNGLWQSSGTGIYYSAGSVGVGINTPNAPLQVYGAPGSNGVQSITSNVTLSSTSGSYDILQRWYENTVNSSFIDLMWLRTAAGADWNSASQRFQAKTDSTWQGYIQWNGTGNGHGLSFGTGSSTVSPNSVSETMRIDSTGNVGIGITSLTDKLEVNGNIRIVDLQSLYVGSNMGNSFRIHHTGNDSYLDFGSGKLVIRHNNGTSIDATPMEILSTGNVAIGHLGGSLGIGTTNPSDKLHLYTAGNTDNIGIITQNGTRQWRAGVRGDSSSIYAIQDDTAAAIRFSINSSGNVGIGTNNPTTSLTILGGLSFPTNNTASGYNYTIASSTSNTWYKVCLIGDSQGKVSFRIVGTIVGGSNPHATGTIDVTISPDNTSGTIYSKISQTDAYNGISWDEFGLQYVIASGGAVLYVKSAANGIRINLNVTASSKNSSSNNVFYTSSSSYSLSFSGSMTSIIDTGIGTITSQWNVYTTNMSIIQNNTSGNVGIGTNIPTTRLHLYEVGTNVIRLQTSSVDNGYIVGNTEYVSINTNSDAGEVRTNVGRGSSKIILNQPQAGGYIQFLTSPAINTNLQERMRISSSGFVGIGTNNPTQALDVVGTVNVTGSVVVGGTVLPVTNGSVWATSGTNILYSAGNVGVSRRRVAFSNTAEDPNHSIYNNYNNLDGEGSWDGFKMNVFNGLNVRVGNAFGAVPTSAFYINSTGQVGIGTTNPLTSLHIARSVTAANDYSLMTYYENTYPSYHDWAVGPYIESNAAAFAIRSGSNNPPGSLTNLLFIDGYGTAIKFPAYTTTGTMTMTAGGVITSGASDRRIKENITYYTDTYSALQKIQKLKPVQFNYISDSRVHIGFIAQDLEEQIPEAVDGKKYEWIWQMDPNGQPKLDENGQIIYRLDSNGNRIVRPRSIEDRAIIAIQTLAIQEQQKQITDLQSHLISIQNELADKSAQLTSLLTWARTQGFSE